MILFSLLILIACFVIFVKWKLTYWQRRGVNTEDPVFFFGNIWKVLQGFESVQEASLKRYKYLKLLDRRYGGMYALMEAMFVPIDPQLVKRIMTKDFHHFQGHGIYYHQKDLLTNNLFNLEGESWLNLRRKLTPTFTSGQMKMMFHTLLEKANILESVINSYAERHDSIDIKDILGRFTTDNIASCGFGFECNSLEENDNSFREHGKESIKAIPTWKYMSLYLLPWSLLANLGFKVLGRKVDKFFDQTVRQTIHAREASGIYRKDFMHLLLQIRKQGFTSDSAKIDKNTQLSDEEIISQCFLFFFAGFETSSTTSSFTLLSLAQYPDIQEKLRQEIFDTLESTGGEITYDNVNQMTYLHKVVSETLRKYPPIANIPRTCTKDYKVPDSDLTIKKGMRVQIPLWGIQMDPEYYPEPEKFDPERFSEENIAKRPEFTYFPFGEGPRTCIGLRFGIMQSKIAIVALLRRFRFSLNNRTDLPITMARKSFVLSVQGDIWLNVERI